METGCISNARKYREILLGQEKGWEVVHLFFILHISHYPPCSFISARAGMTVLSERRLNQSSSSIFSPGSLWEGPFRCKSSDPFSSQTQIQLSMAPVNSLVLE